MRAASYEPPFPIYRLTARLGTRTVPIAYTLRRNDEGLVVMSWWREDKGGPRLTYVHGAMISALVQADALCHE